MSCNQEECDRLRVFSDATDRMARDVLEQNQRLRAELAGLRRPSIDEVPADGQVYRRDQIVPVWCVRCPDCGNMIGHPSFGEAAGREAVAGWLPFHRIRCEGKR